MWNSLLRWTVGYGYQTWKAGWCLLVLVGLGWGIFHFAHNPYPAHLLAAKPPSERPWFHAGLYALDLLLPFADLGYQSSWIAGGWARWLFLGWNLAGWVLITAVLAALSGLIKRD
jgi:disulfide bond formation protein DsbB